MITQFRMKREDNGNEYVVKCDVAHLLPLRIGRGCKTSVKLGERFRRTSKLDDSEYVEVLVKIGKTGVASTKGLFLLKSDAMGINPDQRIDAMKADSELGCPIEYDEAGRAVFRSKKQYQRYAEAHGFFDKNGGHSSPMKRDERERDTRHLPQLYNEEPAEIAIPGIHY